MKIVPETQAKLMKRDAAGRCCFLANFKGIWTLLLQCDGRVPKSATVCDVLRDITPHFTTPPILSLPIVNTLKSLLNSILSRDTLSCLVVCENVLGCRGGLFNQCCSLLKPHAAQSWGWFNAMKRNIYRFVCKWEIFVLTTDAARLIWNLNQEQLNI